MNVEPPETLVIIESIVYKSNGFAIYLIATELQNQIDIKIIDWSALERRQYDIQGIPLKQPITKIDGEMNYELVFDRPNYFGL